MALGAPLTPGVETMIKAVIFDLDNCLAAADEPGRSLLEPTFAAIRDANRGTVPNDTLERAFAECWRTPLDAVARQFAFSDEMLAAGWAVNRSAEVTSPMSGYGDLHVLESLPVLSFLVTSGFRRLQASKVRALGIEHHFVQIHVDAIDEPHRRGKEQIFREILHQYELDAREAVVVGDSAHSEIAAGNRLGILTVQILRPGVTPSDTASYAITTLQELPALLRQLG